MKRLKTFALYILILVIFFFFSRVIIFIGLNNTYKNINLQGEMPESISISSSKATSVNGEIKGKVLEGLDAKYVNFNFYTDTNTLMGSYYITPSELKNNEFEFYFKLNNIKSYSIELTDEVPTIVSAENFSYEEFSKYVLVSALIALMLM